MWKCCEQSCTWLATSLVSDDNPNCQNVIAHTVVEEIHNETTSGQARFVTIKKQAGGVFDLHSGELLKSRIAAREYDSWGNATEEFRGRGDAGTMVFDEATRNFDPDVQNWWPDKLVSQTVKHNPVLRLSGPAIGRGTDETKQVTTNLQYNSMHRLPSSAMTTATGTSLSLSITRQYNDRGLPVLVTTTGTDVTGPRTVAIAYTANGTTQSPNGYFPLTMTNALGHETRTETDPVHGRTTEVTDPNGLVSTTTYDAFGRESEVFPAGEPTQHLRYFWCGVTPCPSGAAYMVGTYAAGAPETNTYLDQLGRERRVSVRNFADIGFIHEDTEYDERGHKTVESQLYDPLAGESAQIGTRYLSYDALGRLMAKEQDQAISFPFLTSYSYQGLKTSINAGGLLMHRVYNGLEQLVEMPRAGSPATPTTAPATRSSSRTPTATASRRPTTPSATSCG